LHDCTDKAVLRAYEVADVLKVSDVVYTTTAMLRNQRAYKLEADFTVREVRYLMGAG